MASSSEWIQPIEKATACSAFFPKEDKHSHCNTFNAFDSQIFQLVPGNIKEFPIGHVNLDASDGVLSSADGPDK